MALKKVIPERVGYKGRHISMAPDGSFIVSKQLTDEIKKITRVGISFYQDDEDTTLWYFRFHSDATIRVRIGRDGQSSFNAKQITQKLMKSIGVADFKNRVRVVVSDAVEVEGLMVYPVITASIKAQL